MDDLTTTHKRFLFELLLAPVAYAAAVLISGQLLVGIESGAGRVFLALLPVPPMVALALVVIRYLRRLDEMARCIHLEVLVLASVGTALLTFACGLLETTDFPRLPTSFVQSLMGAFWTIGHVLGLRRYVRGTGLASCVRSAIGHRRSWPESQRYRGRR